MEENDICERSSRSMRTVPNATVPLSFLLLLLTIFLNGVWKAGNAALLGGIEENLSFISTSTVGSGCEVLLCSTTWHD